MLNVLETGVVSSQHQTEHLDSATQRAPTDCVDKRAVVFPSDVLLQAKQARTLVANERYHAVIATKIRVKRTFEDGRGIRGILLSIEVSLFKINPLKPKHRLLYLKTQSVPRCKHFSSRL